MYTREAFLLANAYTILTQLESAAVGHNVLRFHSRFARPRWWFFTAQKMHMKVYSVEYYVCTFDIVSVAHNLLVLKYQE